MNRKGTVHVPVLRTLVGLVLALALLQGTVLVTATPPPTWTPPEIVKIANKTHMGIGDQVRFTVTVTNPASPPPPSVAVTWYEVHATDVVSPELHIDNVGVTGTYSSVNIVGNTVVVAANTLAPGQWFVATIDCTLVGPAEPGSSITNYATVDYEDDTGDPGEPIHSALVTIKVDYQALLPVVFRRYGP
jgi:fimbrial isopeptide formation D2 family protein